MFIASFTRIEEKHQSEPKQKKITAQKSIKTLEIRQNRPTDGAK